MSAVYVIDSYVHNGRVAVLVEMAAESDYATRTDEFKSVARDIASLARQLNGSWMVIN